MYTHFNKYVCLSMCVTVYVSVCPRAYLRNHTSNLYFCACHLWPSPVLHWRRCDMLCTSALRMTSCLHTMAREDDAKRAYTKSDSTGGSTDLTRQRTNRPSNGPGTKSDIYDLPCQVMDSRSTPSRSGFKYQPQTTCLQIISIAKQYNVVDKSSLKSCSHTLD